MSVSLINVSHFSFFESLFIYFFLFFLSSKFVLHFFVFLFCFLRGYQGSGDVYANSLLHT